MKIAATFLVYAFFLITLTNCKDGNDAVVPVEKIVPTNLIIESTVSADGSGLVTFQATADFTDRFQYNFGEDISLGNFNSSDGAAEHTYKSSGTYNVIVIAISSDNSTLNKATTIVVDVKISDVGYTTLDNYDGMNLIWQDEFNGVSLNSSDWSHEVGGSGWGNNELQYYQAANTTFNDGYLVITAKKENVGGKSYTSSRLITKGKKEFKYGRVDIRAILPKGQGMWPALWMLGANISTVSWPKCGEIDIMEIIGGSGKDNVVHGTVHWDNAGSYASYGQSKALPSPKVFADEFHVFSIVWDETKIRWFLDDVQYNEILITPSELSEFQSEFFFIFNVAVGGNWPGSPDGTTVFPQRMAVDYIRVFQPL